ncbi:MAG: preprotein translocase subunit SecG [Muribaculaceae bacterium]|nr:preprotein translocase subunit SecG [Muribaculaceae bacterium]
MEILIQILSVIVAILLIGVVLIQKSKGGGLSSSFAGSNQIMGVRRTNNFIETATWVLASIICVLAIASALIGGGKAETGEELKSTQVNTTPAAAAQGQYGNEAAPKAEANKAPEAAPAAKTEAAPATKAEATPAPAPVAAPATKAPEAAPAAKTEAAPATKAEATPAPAPVATPAPAPVAK